jgi:glycerophosphoryl diester phosphodiesterase
MSRLALLAVLATLAAPVAARAAAPDPWLSMRVLNQAHQGGEDEVPSNTMYGYGVALSEGSDMLELDVHSTKDHQVVVLHDETVDRTTNGTGAVRDMTLAQVQALDAAHWFVPGRSAVHGLPAASYPLRGVRTGKVAPPSGYDAEDFRIPTLDEVLRAYPHTPINVEIKGADQAEKFRVADDLAALLKDVHRKDVIVVSFDQSAIDRFHAQDPDVPLAAGTDAAAGFLLLGRPLPPGTAALQLPYEFSTDSIGIHLGLDGVKVPLAQSWVTKKAHDAGVAVHYWEVPETDAAYRQVLSVCGDGIMTTRPARFEAALEAAHAPRIGGQGGTDGCGHAPPRPQPGCHAGVVKAVAPVGGVVAVRLERWGDLSTACQVTLALRTTRKVRLHAGDRRAVQTLARRTVILPSGRTGPVAHLRVRRAGRSLLHHHPHTRTRVSVRAVR